MAKLAFFAYIMAFLSESTSVSNYEPRCSKFDFEEKVLEKMVRMEHSNELMMGEFRELTSKVKDSLGTMKSEMEDFKRQAEENDRVVQDFIGRPPYAFSAYWLQNHNPEVGDTLIFENIILNEHDVYNAGTGEYTAKVNGTYIFLTTLCFDSGSYGNVQFLANDQAIGTFRVGDRDWTLCSSSSAIANLERDTRIKIILKYRSGTDVFYDYENQLHCSFSGHLIK